jgi:hypothetical protein
MKSPRITLRLPTGLKERLKSYCEQSGTDVSYVVRKALEGLLAAETGSASGEPKKPLAPSESVLNLVPAYLNRTDVREVRKNLFCQLVAASYVAKKHFPLTPRMVESYEALLKLQKLFGAE